MGIALLGASGCTESPPLRGSSSTLSSGLSASELEQLIASRHFTPVSLALSTDAFGLFSATSDGTSPSNETLLVFVFASEEFVPLPIEQVHAFMLDGSLALWMEAKGDSYALCTFRLPAGPKYEIPLGIPSDSWPMGELHADGDRVFWMEVTHVAADPERDQQEFDAETIWMLSLDKAGRPIGSPRKVTDQANSGGLDGNWPDPSFDVCGTKLAYLRYWDERPGIHLLDLESGDDTYLGEGVLPSVSSSLVTWVGTAADGSGEVRAYNLQTGLVTPLVSHAGLPFAGPGYILYIRSQNSGPYPYGNDLILLDEETGRETVLGEIRSSHWGWVDRAPAVGTDKYITWNTHTYESQDKSSLFRLVDRPASQTQSHGPVRDIWAGAYKPPLVVH